MRLSRSRLLLRAALLTFLAAFMAWRALETGRSAGEPDLEPGSALLLSRIALIEWLLAGLALLTAGAVGLALRGRPGRRSLHLGGSPSDPQVPPGGPPTGPPADR